MIPREVIVLAMLIRDCNQEEWDELHPDDQQIDIEAAWRIWNAGWKPTPGATT